MLKGPKSQESNLWALDRNNILFNLKYGKGANHVSGHIT